MKRALTLVSLPGLVLLCTALILIAIPVQPVSGATLNDETDHASVVTFDATTIDVEFNLSDLDIQNVELDGVAYDAIIMPNEGMTWEYGKPMLPMVSRFVIVPPDAGLELEFQINSRRRVEAVRPPALVLDDEIIPPGQYITAGIQDIYPPVAAEMSEPSIIRGVRLVKVTTYPVQYDPNTEEYIYNEQILTNIRFTDAAPVNPVLHPISERKNVSHEFLKFIDAIAINADILLRDDALSISEWAGHYCIAAHPNCIARGIPFFEWRRKAGYKVDFANITSDNDSRNANTVKNRIQDVYDSYLDANEDPFDQLMLIGDFSNHESCGPNSAWILESHVGQSVWGHANHADYLHATLEGDDVHPDVGVSRWCSGGNDLMDLNVGRTLAYEAEPDMDDTDWFTRGAVGSYHWGNSAESAWHVTINTNVRWGEEVLQNLGYDDVRFYENYQWDRSADQYGPWIREQHNDGVNVILSRAECYNWRSNYAGVNNNTVFPIRINTSGHGEWATWNQTRIGNGNSLKGPVAASCGWGGPATVPMSLTWMGMVKGVMNHDMSFGWGFTFSVINIERIIPDFQFGPRPQMVYLNVKTDVDTYGDPAIQPWRGVPLQYDMEHVASMTPDTKSIEVFVFDPNNDDVPVEGARVTLYAPGDIPDDADYISYDDYFQATTFSDIDGFARFIFEEDPGLERGTMYVTLTGRDILPRFGEIDIETNVDALDLANYDLAEVEGEGNGDNNINPGETFSLSLTAVNRSRNADYQDVTAVVTSLSPWIEIDENEISFGDIDSGDEADAEQSVTFLVHASCPDGESRPKTKPVLSIEFHSGDDVFRSAVELIPSAPHFVLRRIVNGNQIPVGQHQLDLDIQNEGSMDAAAAIGLVETQGMGVSIVIEEASYPAINTNRHSNIQGDQFLIAGNRVAIPGSNYPLIMIVTTETGFIDTVHFELQVDEPREHAPQGPDKFGYICFDDTDVDWDISPDYDWIEISPRDGDADYDGEICDFDGRSDLDVGESEVVDMGMSTRFYGQSFDQITICSNGYIAMGNQERITNFQNWPMDQAIGAGVGMIAPFWDWLDIPSNTTGVYYYHDEDENRFIIEWYKLRHHSGGNQDLTFQVILYDEEVWITETGDQNILMQYKTISQVRGQQDGVAGEKSSPYASVGISSIDGRTGINYSFNNEYPVTSAELENGRAILFGTSPRFRSGALFGRVTDEETGRGIEGAVVFTEHGFIANTDADGNWRINDALAEVPFDITAVAQGFNDSTHYELLVEEDAELEINFSLLHPEFIESDDALSAGLEVDDGIVLPFEVLNSGNGPLIWHAEEQLRGDANADPWELRRQYEVGNLVGDQRLQGVLFIDDKFYVPVGNDRDPQIDVFNREGELIDQYPQHGGGFARYGYHDIAWDGELIWGSGETTVSGFTPDGELQRQWEGPFNPNHVMTWDPDREILWIASTTSNIAGYDRDGNQVALLERHGFRMYGLAYWPDDPDGFPLYIFHRNTDIADQILHKMNPETGDTMFVNILEPQGGGTPIGAHITNQFDVYSWVFVAMSNIADGDRIDVWQLDARRDWFELNPSSGVLNQSETQEFTLTLDATGLPVVRFEADLVFYHNADDGMFVLPVTLDVMEGARNLNLGMTEGWNMISINVTPENLNIIDIFQPLVDDGKLALVKNGMGEFYLPEQHFNNIEQWNTAEGYQVNLTEAATLSFSGDIIPAETPIDLEAGWTMVAYYPHNPVDAITAFSGIGEHIEIAKDGAGQFYLPEFGFSNLGNLVEGQGYQLKLVNAARLIFNTDGNVAAYVKAAPKPKHFSSVSHTDSFMPVLAIGNSTMQGWELGVFTATGTLAGSGSFDAEGHCGLAVWGDNALTENTDGSKDGEGLSFKLWNGSDESKAELRLVRGSAVYSSDDYLVGEIILSGSAPVEFGIHNTYPNPTNGPATIEFGIVEPSKVSLSVFDISGRQTVALVNDRLEAGIHRISWNTDLVPSGVYLLQLTAAGQVNSLKIAVVK